SRLIDYRIPKGRTHERKDARKEGRTKGRTHERKDTRKEGHHDSNPCRDRYPCSGPGGRRPVDGPREDGLDARFPAASRQGRYLSTTISTFLRHAGLSPTFGKCCPLQTSHADTAPSRRCRSNCE